jgi:hypothetical protein
MTTEKHDPWALLREAKRLIAANRLMLGHYSGVREVGSLEDRIDAALAERQDSSTDVVEWKPYGDSQIATVNGLSVRVDRVDLRVAWSVTRYGEEITTSEAKSAAIKAARGMK